MNNSFSSELLSWFADHGRHDLPWQSDKTPYKVWVSEIMLQQTQVATVIPYFKRFMARFPSLEDLALAEEDQVLHQWTGLGYYARARNLHKTAQIIYHEMKGQFPDTVEELTALPGIGRSTAGGIIASSMNKHAVILDGNVKRVLCRYLCLEGWPDQSATNKKLWEHAEKFTPAENFAEFNQAIMDLGASLCSKNNPACELCPLKDGCKAFKTGRATEFPHKKPKKKLPVKATTMLVLQNLQSTSVLLEKRPPSGIWGGLWSLPEIPVNTSPDSFLIVHGLKKQAEEERWQPIRHTFSHYHLDITPVLISLKKSPDAVLEKGRWHWYDLQSPGQLGLAAPVKKLLDALAQKI